MLIFPRAQSGQDLDIKADAWNAAMDAAEWVKMLRLRTGDGIPGRSPDYSTILITNLSGGDVPLYGILAIGGVSNFDASYLDRFQFGHVWNSKTAAPASPNDLGRFCIAQEPIAAGQTGRALVCGVTPVQVQVSSGQEALKCADVRGGARDKLDAVDSGCAQILWRDTGTGTKWAIVRLPYGSGGGKQLVPFEMYDDIVPGGTDLYAWPMLGDLSNKDTSADKILVSDLLLGDVRAYGSNHSGVARGARGWCEYNAAANKNVIVAIERLAKVIEILLSADVAAGFDFTGHISHVNVLDDGQDPTTSAVVACWLRSHHSGETIICLANGSGGYRPIYSSRIDNFVATNYQFLAHDKSGYYVWMDIANCPTS